MRKFILSISLLLLTISSYSQEHFIYHNKQKITLTPEPSYFCIKLKPSTSNSIIDNIISSKLIGVKDKTWLMTPGTAKNYKPTNLIVQIKHNISSSAIDDIKSGLLKNSNIESVGECFKKNDKVLHFTTNEIVVRFKSNMSEYDITNLNRLFKTTVIEKVEAFTNTYLLSIESRGEHGIDNAFEVSNKYALTQFVEFAQPNFIRTGMLLGEFKLGNKVASPNDPLFPQMWHLKNTGTNIPQNVIGIPGCDINADSAWMQTTGNENVLISITDTGVDTNHVDLRGNLCDRNLWYDAYANDQQPYDEYYHGTGVTGICSAIGNNGLGTVGVAYNCKFMPVRVFGPFPQGFTTDLILAKGLNWSWQHGAAVINCSWGGGIPSPLIEHSMDDAMQYGRNGKGSVICAGSGNDNRNYILYPANKPGVIGAGGLSPCNQRKSPQSCDNLGDTLQNWGASYGEGLSIAAPCTFIGTTELGGGWCICGNGTSDAAPITSGVAALIISKNNNLSGDSVKMIIETTAKKVGGYNYNVQKENGMWNFEMGYGRIDAKACLDATPQGPTQLFDMVPPIVKITPPRSQVYNNQPILTANIWDNQLVAGGSNTPRLYYFSPQYPSYQFVTGILGSDNNYSFTFPSRMYGTSFYYYIAAQDTSSNRNLTTYPLGGKGTNPPGTLPPSRLMYFRNTETYTETYTSTDVPIIISAVKETTVVSNLNVPVGKTILSVGCLINITHTFDADMTISLIAPDGYETVLTGGTGWDGDNYTNTFFTDDAKVAIDDTSHHPPYTGSFRPVEKLWLHDGTGSAGNWRLKIVDNGAQDGGSLNSWSLTLKYSTINDNTVLPGNFSLVKNYPNPFNPTTRIIFNVPKRAIVRILLYDINGREVATLLNETRNPQLEDFIDFNTNSSSINNGRGLASGVYFYSMFADGEYIESKKMMLIK